MTNAAVSADPIDASIDASIARLRAARDRGVRWLLDHLASNGEPAGAGERNGWARVPWALALSGEGAAAAAVVAWAERAALTDDGFFRPGPALGAGRFLAYPMAHLAIGAWLTERFDTALAIMGALRRLQDPQTGGFPIAAPVEGTVRRCDLLSTAQAGLAALFTQQDDIAEGVHRWIVALHAQQPELPHRLYTFRDGEELLTAPEPALTWLAVTEFAKPRQTFYTPGMAAVFLAAFAMQRKASVAPAALAALAALTLGHAFLDLNRAGTAAQFDDAGSVQICKFGWGVAAMSVADRQADLSGDLLRMGAWFAAHQAPDGAWVPSVFLAPEPSIVDKMVKTAEHVMEVNALLSALGGARARRA